MIPTPTRSLPRRPAITSGCIDSTDNLFAHGGSTRCTRDYKHWPRSPDCLLHSLALCVCALSSTPFTYAFYKRPLQTLRIPIHTPFIYSSERVSSSPWPLLKPSSNMVTAPVATHYVRPLSGYHRCRFPRFSWSPTNGDSVIGDLPPLPT